MSIMMISSRLTPAVTVGDSVISIHPIGAERWEYWIDMPDGKSHHGDDLRGRGDARAMMVSLLGFMGACGESYAYNMRTGKRGENLDLFPPDVAEWCYLNNDELSVIADELDNETE